MEQLITMAQQQQYFEEAIQYKQTGDYRKAEDRLLLVLTNAFATKQFDIFVQANVHLLIIHVNEGSYEKMPAIFQHIQPYTAYYANEQQQQILLLMQLFYDSFMQEIDIQQPLYDMLETATQQRDMDMTYTLLANLLRIHLQSNAYDEAHHLRNIYDPHLPIEDVTDVVGYFIYFATCCELFYQQQQFSQIEYMLIQMEQHQLYTKVGLFGFSYWYYKALCAVQQKQLPVAIAYMQQAVALDPSLLRSRKAVDHWLDVLEAHAQYEEMMQWQEIVIQSIDAHMQVLESRERIRMIEELAISKMQENLYTDRLTGVRNRAFYEDELEKGDMHTDYCVVVFDIDKFKSINDGYGHLVGDRAIKFIAQLAKDAMNEKYMHVIRYGGDEFIILLKAPIDDIYPLIQKLHETIAQTDFFVEETNEYLRITVSMGISTTHTTPMTIQTLFKQADEALYVAKDNGRNCIHLYTDVPTNTRKSM